MNTPIIGTSLTVAKMLPVGAAETSIVSGYKNSINQNTI